MPIPSPYRSLPPARRAALLAQALAAHRELRGVYAQRLAARGGGFRAATVQAWPAERLAREVVRLNAETPQDELDLLHFLFVELEPATQISFLDAAGVRHADGVMADDLEAPYADATRCAAPRPWCASGTARTASGTCARWPGTAARAGRGSRAWWPSTAGDARRDVSAR
jgi:hypothetical protein